MRQIFLLLLCIGTQILPAQNRIAITVSGLKSTKAYLGYYYGDMGHLADSTAVDTLTGNMVFQPKALQPGMYFLAIPEGRLFNFLVERTPAVFELKSSLENLHLIEATNSPENTAFFQYQSDMAILQQQLEDLRIRYDLISRASNDPAILAEQQKFILGINDQMRERSQAFVKAYPKYVYSKGLLAIEQPKAPENIPQVLPDGAQNPGWYEWINRHFWDKADFSTDAVLRNNLFSAALNNYIRGYTAPHPDSINHAIDRLLLQMPPQGPVFQFTADYYTQAFEMTEWANSDRVFVHMADTWMRPDNAPWHDEATLLRIKDKADMHRPNLTGSKAPSLRLPDQYGKMVDLDTIQARLTLLVFYSPLCTHCMEKMPDIYQTWLDARNYGVAALAVNVDELYANWQQFVGQQSWEWYNLADPTEKNSFEADFAAFNLPVIYLLDKNKTILRKRVKVEDLRQLLEVYLRQ